MFHVELRKSYKFIPLLDHEYFYHPKCQGFLASGISCNRLGLR